MPSLYIIAGPNGAGKTTFVRDFLRYDFGVLDFLNADEIARGLSPLAPERAQLEAGRLMIERVRRFIGEGRDFGMETTLSGRTYRNTCRNARECGYSIHLDFLLLPDVEDSMRRVSDRVAAGDITFQRATCAGASEQVYKIYSVFTGRFCIRGRSTIIRDSVHTNWPKGIPEITLSLIRRRLRKSLLNLTFPYES